MARRGRAGRTRSKRRWLRWLFALLLVAALLAAGFMWWRTGEWTPDPAAYRDAGVLVSDKAGDVNFRTLNALGADFAYIEASHGTAARDLHFTENLENARAAGLEVGVVHHFDPCVPADGQSANFVTLVPREANLLPPAIALDRIADTCEQRVGEAEVESELMTLINQIEIHAGVPVLLKPSKRFEEEYGIAGRIERNLWLSQNWTEPDYGRRPWLLWTANDMLRTEASAQPIAWVVVRP